MMTSLAGTLKDGRDIFCESDIAGRRGCLRLGNRRKETNQSGA
jgi:hypothetical protein